MSNVRATVTCCLHLSFFCSEANGAADGLEQPRPNAEAGPPAAAAPIVVVAASSSSAQVQAAEPVASTSRSADGGDAQSRENDRLRKELARAKARLAAEEAAHEAYAHDIKSLQWRVGQLEHQMAVNSKTCARTAKLIKRQEAYERRTRQQLTELRSQVAGRLAKFVRREKMYRQVIESLMAAQSDKSKCDQEQPSAAKKARRSASFGLAAAMAAAQRALGRNASDSDSDLDSDLESVSTLDSDMSLSSDSDQN